MAIYMSVTIVYLDMDIFFEKKNTIISLKNQHFKNKTPLKEGERRGNLNKWTSKAGIM